MPEKHTPNPEERAAAQAELEQFTADHMTPVDPMFDFYFGERDSEIAIREAIREALEARDMTAYELHELSGVPLDEVGGLIEGAAGSLRDSENLTKIEAVLGVSLRHL